jgi:aminocarboxymuconate-semialdehyde decarboxylase
MDYFHRFYGDTAMFGGSTGLHSGLKFFGADHVVFSTDSPFAPIKETIAALDALELSAEDREKITNGNARRLLKL